MKNSHFGKSFYIYNNRNMTSQILKGATFPSKLINFRMNACSYHKHFHPHGLTPVD